MTSSATSLRRVPWVISTIIGLGTWILGYAFTYLIVAPDIRGSFLQQIIEAFNGNPATYEMVGWVFFNAHFVDTVFQNVPLIGGQTTSFIGGDDGFTTLVYVIPVGLLVAAGMGIARYQAADTLNRGALLGITVLPGYLIGVLGSLFLFEVTIGGVTGAPAMLPGIVVAGLIYPLVLAGAGGGFAGLTGE